MDWLIEHRVGAFWWGWESKGNSIIVGCSPWVQPHWTNKLDSNVVRDSLGKEVAEEKEKLVIKEDVGFGEINFAYLISLIIYISPIFLFSLKWR